MKDLIKTLADKKHDFKRNLLIGAGALLVFCIGSCSGCKHAKDIEKKVRTGPTTVVQPEVVQPEVIGTEKEALLELGDDKVNVKVTEFTYKGSVFIIVEHEDYKQILKF
jgi:hypothetical protein